MEMLLDVGVNVSAINRWTQSKDFQHRQLAVGLQLVQLHPIAAASIST